MDALTERYNLTCPECGGQLRLKNSKNGRFYGCENWPWSKCPGGIGAHGDGKPLGIPAGRETREARVRVHDVFDLLWKKDGLSRGHAYRQLQRMMEMTPEQCHVGNFNLEECAKAISKLENFRGNR